MLRGTVRHTDLKVILSRYLAADNAIIAASDLHVVEFLARSLTGSVEGVTMMWVDAWIRSMKQGRAIAPGTIRKRVESLARCIDWWNRHRSAIDHDAVALNPLRALPTGYSVYKADPAGEPVPRDIERNRRLLPGECERIEYGLTGGRRADRERPWAQGGDPDFLMLFRLLVGTGLRLREAYTLLVENVRFDLLTIHVRRSKTGAKRDVPMTQDLEEMLRGYIGSKAPASPLFSFWNGSLDPVELRHLTAKLSARFGTLFDYADCPDLVQHDLRHEATCRWMEMRDDQGRWLFRPEEVRKITGHKSDSMFMRYLSLQGSDLASRLRPNFDRVPNVTPHAH